MNISQRIKDLRYSKRLTQKDLAKLLNVKPTTVSGWELGRNEPSIDTLNNLSKIFDVSVDYLTGKSDTFKSSAVTDADLEDMLDNARSFDGKPMSDHDREIIKAYLKGYYAAK